MKKWLTGALVILGISGVASVAHADSFGVRSGYPFLGIQYTMGGAPSTPGVRVVLSSLFYNANLQVDYLMHMPLSGIDNLSLYYGGGANLGAVFSGGISAGAQGTLGVEYRLNPSISLFADTSLGIVYYFGGGISPYTAGGFGVNFRL